MSFHFKNHASHDKFLKMNYPKLIHFLTGGFSRAHFREITNLSFAIAGRFLGIRKNVTVTSIHAIGVLEYFCGLSYLSLIIIRCSRNDLDLEKKTCTI